MADILHDVLVARSSGSQPRPGAETLSYLTYLSKKSPRSIDTAEPQRLTQESQSLSIALQALSKRSHKSLITSATHHSKFGIALPAFTAGADGLRKAIIGLDTEALHFASKYSKTNENDALARRKKALLLVRNVERIVDVLELPALLSTAISGTPPNYSSALDLNSHIRRLHSIYPTSALINSVSIQADQVTQKLAGDLILSMATQGLKLAASLRTIGWLRRVVQDLNQEMNSGRGAIDHCLGFIFLCCRITTLVTTLDALLPLQKLADEEKARQAPPGKGSASWSGGQQTERYLKRYIEIFREQSFGILSMHKSLFPNATCIRVSTLDPLHPMPSPIAAFPSRLVDILLAALREYLPNITDQAARDSILTQVLYCAGSLGRLGGDFGALLTEICQVHRGDQGEGEWVDVVKRHRLLSGRLESVIGDYKGINVRES